MCVYVYTHICVCVCIYIYIYICSHPGLGNLVLDLVDGRASSACAYTKHINEPYVDTINHIFNIVIIVSAISSVIRHAMICHLA